MTESISTADVLDYLHSHHLVHLHTLSAVDADAAEAAGDHHTAFLARSVDAVIETARLLLVANDEFAETAAALVQLTTTLREHGSDTRAHLAHGVRPRLPGTPARTSGPVLGPYGDRLQLRADTAVVLHEALLRQLEPFRTLPQLQT